MTRNEAPHAAAPGAVRHGAKSPAAFRTTGEVAGELDLPAHVLRFWESKFPQIKPLKRGGGRRYYRPEDVDLLRRIRQCLYLQGYTIRGVQKLLRDGGLPGEAPIARPAAEAPPPALFVFEQAGDPRGDASAKQALHEALEGVRRELHEIRGLLRQMVPDGGSTPL